MWFDIHECLKCNEIIPHWMAFYKKKREKQLLLELVHQSTEQYACEHYFHSCWCRDFLESEKKTTTNKFWMNENFIKFKPVAYTMYIVEKYVKE